jgi:hypothetical protein
LGENSTPASIRRDGEVTDRISDNAQANNQLQTMRYFSGPGIHLLRTGLLCGELSSPQRHAKLRQLRRQFGAEYHFLPARRMLDNQQISMKGLS